MKLFILLAALIAATCALSDHQQWTEFKVNFSRQYEPHEENVRFEIFQNNLRKIEEHNAKYDKGEVSYYMRVNKFADWTKEEFNQLLISQISSKPDIEDIEEFKINPNFVSSESFDWRQKGAVTAVKDQGTCTSGWAFSTTGALEGQLAILQKNYNELSEQELVDCDTTNNGCVYGEMRYALNYVRQNGIMSEASYPYEGVSGSCRNSSNKVISQISGYVRVRHESELEQVVAGVGPVSVGLSVNDEWQLYGGGIFDSRDCGRDYKHGALLVGYDPEAWIIKNSWGTSWGEEGYIRLVRGRNQCGIIIQAVFPRLKIKMQLFFLLATFIAATFALSDYQQWAEFKGNFSRQYGLKEEKVRFQIFINNLRKIEEHNAKYDKGEVSYYMRVNKFADWTKEEFSEILKAQISSKPDIEDTDVFEVDSNFVRPESIDWRQVGAVSAVKDQGICGSCWAFSVTGTLEGQLAIQRKSYIALSVQELVDCDTSDMGCDGGDMRPALDFVKNNGLMSEADYPYVGYSGSCKTSSNKVISKITGYVPVRPTEEALADAVASVGPISVGLNADFDWQFYGGGIFDHFSCDDDLNHGVLAVGYTPEAWIIKNSWGTSWGEEGYIRLVRGKNQCGVSLYCTYPKL
ncbi:uncharacterized protein LOC130442924 [Diorhabda sublineata]|uniref:uncharacterized protein LOC130442924 n=1 Tax=Diorhabda sublineata TaxID=1163346 RepID=UPI0024E0B554|nr:uncharacterized protein LOC130442924 [Diorhabda sublineata]